jgi:hypothetical protein
VQRRIGGTRPPASAVHSGSNADRRKETAMATGACGINCDVCRLNLIGICGTCGSGTSREAASKIEVQTQLFGHPCPILACARERRIRYCLRDCTSFPCEHFSAGPYPFSEDYLTMQKRRRSQKPPARTPTGNVIVVPETHWDALANENLDTLCAWAGAKPHLSNGLRLPVLNTDVVVDLDGRTVEPVEPDGLEGADPSLLELLVLVYLMGVTSDQLTGDMISAQELRDSQFFQGPHALKTDPLLRAYANDPEGLRAAAERLGGQPRALADIAYALFPFPKIPLYYLLWQGDDQFGAHLSILFDRSIEIHLAADAIWGTVNMVSALMLEC